MHLKVHAGHRHHMRDAVRTPCIHSNLLIGWRSVIGDMLSALWHSMPCMLQLVQCQWQRVLEQSPVPTCSIDA